MIVETHAELVSFVSYNCTTLAGALTISNIDVSASPAFAVALGRLTAIVGSLVITNATGLDLGALANLTSLSTQSVPLYLNSYGLYIEGMCTSLAFSTPSFTHTSIQETRT